MNPPPVLSSETCSQPEWPGYRPRWKWAVFTLLLLPYPVILGLLPEVMKRMRGLDAGDPMLPGSVLGLMYVGVESLLSFAVPFGVACWIARPTRTDLRWQWTGGPFTGGVLTAVSGAIHSVGIRIMVSITLLLVMGTAMILNKGNPEVMNQFKPKLDGLVPLRALSDPGYVFTAMTWISFVVAGLREELWRVSVLAGITGLLPLQWSLRRRIGIALTVSSIAFGIGHVVQGTAGVIATTLLGFALGGIILFHRSIWVAVIAHGLFDATTFGLLWALVKSGMADSIFSK